MVETKEKDIPILVLFGPPGAGKTHTNNLLQQHFGFYHYDTKVDFTDEQKLAIAQRRPITEAMGVEFFDRVHRRVRELREQGENVSVDNAFIYDRFRREFLVSFLDATFVLVETPPELRTERITKVRGSTHMLPPDLALK